MTGPGHEIPPAARPLRVAVVGPSDATESMLRDAERCGVLLAQRGAALLSGGRGGVMAAASRGALSAGGITVGVLPGHDAGEANPWVALPLTTGLGEARNALLVAMAQAVLAVGLSWGTLSEVSLAMATGKPAVALGVEPLPLRGLLHAATPEQAVDAVMRALRQT